MRRGASGRTSFGSGSIPRSRAMRWAAVVWSPSSPPGSGIGGSFPGISSGPLPPRARSGSREMEDQPGGQEGGQGEIHKGGPPGQRRNPARDAETDRRSDELSREDIAVDPPALGGREPVTDE